MSRINAIRIANLNYNNNAIHVDDEIFELGTESTLFSLRNGGGKSVLVQMMSAPFVRKRYRDTKDRPFESYFTGNRPTYILVEWALDGNNGYVLTGMMVKRAAENKEEETQDPLDTVQFIYEYRTRNEYDIYRFPLITQENEGKKLLGFGQGKQLFEDLKKELKFMFNFYDMNQPNQSRSYFEKLKEYGINHKEWESIIKKINLKESGLSELFAEAKDESGLVDKWFLPAVEDKLSKEENRIDKFVELIQKYIRQYKENRANFAKKETIDLFKVETKNLMEMAATYQSKVVNQRQLENKIANLIELLKQVIDNLSLQQKETTLAMEQISREMNRIECAEIAYDIYLKQDELAKQKELLTVCEELLLKIDSEQKELNLKIKQYECSKINATRQEARKEVITVEAELDQIRRKEEDLTPERNNLGYSIGMYYQEKIAITKEELSEQEEMLNDINKEQEDCATTVEQYNATIANYSEENGTLKSNMKAYGQVEAEFNARYKENLGRNIVGTYEEELLPKKKSEIEAELVELEHRRKEVLAQGEEARRNLEDKEHRKSEIQVAAASEQGFKERLLQKQADYERLILERKALLPYVELSEEDVFETAKIVAAFEQKLTLLRESLKQYVVLEEKKQKELEQLKSGKVLELPKEIEEKLQQLEIHYIYGMEWLKNNGKTEDENQKIVDANPFIPYAIILGNKEFEQLSKNDLGIHTSFPIPIVKREELELELQKKESKLYRYSEVSFYISFNHNLLDKTGLEHLIELKSSELMDCRKHLTTIQEEMNHYEDKKNVVLFERFSKEEIKQCENNLTKAVRKLADFDAELAQISDEIIKLRREQLILVKTAESIGHSLEVTKEKYDTFVRLMKQYETYQMEKERTIFLTDEIKRLKQVISDIKLSQGRLKTKEQEVRHKKEQTAIELSSLEEKSKQFESFLSGTLLSQSIDEMEARFTIITKNIHQEETLLEERLTNAKKRLVEAEHELEVLVKEYQFESKDYENLTYSMELMLMYRKSLEAYEQQKTAKTEEKMKLSNEMTRLRTQIYAKKEEYEKKSGSRELILRDQLTVINFKEVTHIKYLERQEKEKDLVGIEVKLAGCRNVLTSLSEYEEFEVTEPLDLRFQFSDLNRMKNEALKELRFAKDEVNKCSTLVMQEIARLLRNPAFAEEYYHKPLEALETLIDSPDTIIEQLTTTIAAYDHLLLKLSIDLQMIEKEGEKVLEVLLQYIQEVHENLGKIDRNSTITIRDRNIKMLKIKLPEWEEEKKTYTLKCKDYLENLVGRALELLDENKNTEALVASYITTKNLYHQVVGVGNVGIHLYKIEEEREYPITWTEVSKNSGGEGFLSAFVILSSLLSYMRRDDTDIFNDKDSGKVLIMDNPFAQTNAAHLLKPLMDIARKSNTQLICLSGLGGESIYNRFDNIYVLNLVSSKIKESMQYLYGDHIKGEELASIVATRIQVEEEQMVLF